MLKNLQFDEIFGECRLNFQIYVNSFNKKIWQRIFKANFEENFEHVKNLVSIEAHSMYTGSYNKECIMSLPF